MSGEGGATPVPAAPALAGIADPGVVIFANPGYVPGAEGKLAARYRAVADDVAAVLRAAPGYAPTPLIRLPMLARAIGCETLLFKDEGPRFGLGSFKAAGAAYAMIREIERQLGEKIDPAKAFRGGYRDRLRRLTFATATSGNHGRALAWACQAVGARCIGPDGAPAPTTCVTGVCAPLGARDLCTLGCASDPCPPEAACATFAVDQQHPLCLARCDMAHPCDDPLLACQAAGAPGPYGFTVPMNEPMGATFCAPKRCAVAGDCAPSGMCDGPDGGSYCSP